MAAMVMHAVSVVPENAEVRRGGLQAREAAHGFVAVGNALGVGILGHAPDALDGFILPHQLFHDIHIGAGGGHGHGHHFDAEIFGNGKMPVIARHGTQEFHFRQTAPGGVAHHAVSPHPADGIEHHVQGGIAVDDDVLGVVFHHVAQQLPRFLNAGELAVVPAVGAVLTGEIAGGIQHVHHAHGKIQLFLARLAPAHVQMHAQRLHPLVLGLELRQFHVQFFYCHLRIRLHGNTPSLC